MSGMLQSLAKERSQRTASPSKRCRVTVEDVEDEGDTQPSSWSRDSLVFVDYPDAGAEIEGAGEGETTFERIRREKQKRGEEVWAPFKSRKEWELARWLMMSGVSQADIDRFAKLGVIQEKVEPSFKDKRTFLSKIDELPSALGTEWKCEEFELVGNVLDKDGTPVVQTIELWKRNPVACIKELMQDPRFAKHMRYAPEKMYTDEGMKHQAFDEMATGKWWWAMQACIPCLYNLLQDFNNGCIQKLLPKGATIAAIILSSDKTQLSTFSGDKSAWPVYLTLGNIDASVRRKPSEQATILIGYIPVSKLECFTEDRRSVEGYQLFHDCMRTLLKPLIEAGQNGVEMLCSDGRTRLVFPLLAAYVADYPEQCLIAGCGERRCPKCTATSKELGDPLHSVLRDPEKTIDALKATHMGNHTQFKNLGLRPITPFWTDLPRCNIFHCFTPDLLHQLHKGVFKDHLVKWLTKAADATKAEVDRRYMAMPQHPDLRHFKKGISLVMQWTGTEYKNMEKVFLGALAGTAKPDVIICVRAVLDFIYYSHLELHTDESLKKLEDSLRTFHAHKHIFVDDGIREHFNIPKVHSMVHYAAMIRSHGVTGGYNTEASERLHIDFAKRAYQASNRKGYIQQMTKDEVDEVEDDVDVADGDEEAAAHAEINTELTKDTNGDQIASRVSLQHGESTYTIPKRPSFTGINIATLENQYGTRQFVHCLEFFLRDHGLLKDDFWDARPAKYQVYKRFRICIPPVPEVSTTVTLDVIRALPSHTTGTRRKKYVPAQFDTVLARRDLPLDKKQDLDLLGVNGLHVAQVRAIFNLPEELGSFPHPLVYVEWFTPLRRVDEHTQMFRVERFLRHDYNCNKTDGFSFTNVYMSCYTTIVNLDRQLLILNIVGMNSNIPHIMEYDLSVEEMHMQ
ncbi:hypothetical protein ARMGADRAFT_1062603 [Armillaria gallica]|uniref:CxC2-like cysteine cluster KDZ transposase-associated domain-containing protein n=1 Tax=Armillaria gallica TaxID=47427 RepID=A0A2H3DSQ0_ARMGA|nr:hypothetical protein ARMGADRAFT_1062603 [Armillaria gallica]